MENKVVLFELEKGVDIPSITWSQEDVGKNIWSTSYTIEPNMNKDVASVVDEENNRFYKCYSYNQLESDELKITLRNYTFTVHLEETDTTPELIATRIRNHTFYYNGWEIGNAEGIDPEDPTVYAISGKQTWITGGSGAIVTFTPTDPYWDDDLGNPFFAQQWAGPLELDLTSGNITASLTNTTQGRFATGSKKEEWNCRISIEDFIKNEQDESFRIKIREYDYTVICLYSWISIYIEQGADYKTLMTEFCNKLGLALKAAFPVNTYDFYLGFNDPQASDPYGIRILRQDQLTHTEESFVVSNIITYLELIQEGITTPTITGIREVNTLEIESVNDSHRAFYFDRINSILYLRLPSGSEPTDFDLSASLKMGYSNFEGYYDPLNVGYQLFYEGRLISIPNIAYRKDSTYYSIVSFDGGSITLNNTDGFFDNIDEDDVYGQICTLRYSDGSAFQTIYTGYFESFQLNGIPGQCIVNVYDKRKVFSKSLPTTYFSLNDYPYLNTQNDGLPIPVGFGKINKATAICLNETETPIPSYYTFKVCNSDYPIQSVDAVFVEGVDVTPVNVDLVNNTFQLANTDYVAGKATSVSYHGWVVNGTLLENPIEVLEFILEKWAGLLKNSFNYNLTEWNAARDKVGIPMIGLHIAESKSMIDIIGEIANSVFGTFLIQKDGLITFKIRDVTIPPVATIRVDDQIAAPVQNYKSEEYANSVRIGHSKAWSNGKHSWVTIDDQEEALFNRYRVNAGKEVYTLLSDKNDAITYGDSLYLQYAGIFPTFTIVTKNQFLNLALEDLIDVEVYILPDGSFGTVRLEVLGVEADLNSNIVTITGRFVSFGGNYAGKKLIKFVSRS